MQYIIMAVRAGFTDPEICWICKEECIIVVFMCEFASFKVSGAITTFLLIAKHGRASEVSHGRAGEVSHGWDLMRTTVVYWFLLENLDK